jgi:hypothetical protein
MWTADLLSKELHLNIKSFLQSNLGLPKINGAASQAYFQHDYPQQNYRVYLGGGSTSASTSNTVTPPTPPKGPPSVAPPPPPPKPPRTSHSDPVLPQYSSYSMPEENLYMNGGPAGSVIGSQIPDAGFSNRPEMKNASPYHHQTGYV